MIIINKYCTKCNRTLPITSFYKSNFVKSGIYSYCKECQFKKNKIYQQKNKEKINCYNRKSYHKNKLKQHRIYMLIKSSASKRKILFNLDVDYFKDFENKKCYLCNDKLVDSTCGAGLDRLDSSKGYIKSNVRFCCGVCNKMKNVHNLTFFINHIKKIIKNKNGGEI